MNVHQNARLTPQGRLLLVERITQQGWKTTSSKYRLKISRHSSIGRA
jgi:hypothetical protein